MARRKQKTNAEFVLFDVLYDDGSRSSNRRVPASELEGPDGDDAARSVIEAQDREIAAMSGRPRGRIKSVTRSPVR
jgi:ATP-dependent DNA ligase